MGLGRFTFIKSPSRVARSQGFRRPSMRLRCSIYREMRLSCWVANYDGLDKGNSYWVEPVAGGAPRPVGTLRGQDASFGADGTSLIYNKGTGYVVTTDLYSVSRDGSASRKLLATDGYASGFRFPPDGSRLRFTLEKDGQNHVRHGGCVECHRAGQDVRWMLW